eukprot:878881-Rhodomonas_salina.1
MASGFSSSGADDYAQAVHGATRSGWDEATAPDSLRLGPGTIIDTSRRERLWNQAQTPHVHSDDHIHDITVHLEHSQVQPFNMEGDDPLFSRVVRRPHSVNGATERPRPTTDAPQMAARHDNPDSRPRRQSTSQSPDAAGSRPDSASSNRSFRTATPPSHHGSRSRSRSSSRSGQRPKSKSDTQ